MSGYYLQVSGKPTLLYNGEALSITRKKALALLIYLYFSENPVPSDYAAELLWPENVKNRQNLRAVLTYLNHINGGRMEEAVFLNGRIQSLNPCSPEAFVLPGVIHYFSGRFRESLEHYERFLSLKPNDIYAHFCYPWMLVQAGQKDEAKGRLDKFIGGELYSYEGVFVPESFLGVFFHKTLFGSPGKALAYFNGEVDENNRLSSVQFKKAAEGSLYFAFYAAVCCALIGEDKAALYWMRRSCVNGFTNYGYVFEHDTVLKHLIDTKEGESIYRDMKRGSDALPF